MSIRTEDQSRWKSKALEISGKLNTFMTPLLEEALANNMTYEDFHYLVCDCVHMLVLAHSRKKYMEKIKEYEENNKR